jgi:hypothetical protein
MKIENSEFWGGMRQCFECVRLVEHLLKERESVVDSYHKKGLPVPNSVHYDIARMKYALGETDLWDVKDSEIIEAVSRID